MYIAKDLYNGSGILHISICRRICCCKKRSPDKLMYTVICLGLQGCGKSTLLALLSGEETDNIKPTIGFSIKALIFDDCFLDVKELGGGDQVRPYWNRYFQYTQGIIFVVDSSCPEDDLKMSKDELNKALSDVNLRGLSLLVLANYQDKDGARPIEQLTSYFDLESLTGKRKWVICPCSSSNKAQVYEAFTKMTAFLLGHRKSTKELNKDVGPQRI